MRRLLYLVCLGLIGCIDFAYPNLSDREAPFALRPLDVPIHGISYGPHRDGQRPGNKGPKKSEIREDLHIIASHWKLLRIYGSAEFGGDVLSVIREDQLDLKVMVGAWIDPEEVPREDGEGVEYEVKRRFANHRELKKAIGLANKYPEIVVAVCVGNETQVFWSAHKSSLETLTAYIRHVRTGVRVPVTTADDYNFWNKPESQSLAEELDFITLHAHPLWNGIQREDALQWQEEQLEIVQAMHPDHRVVLGETGWATMRHDEGLEAELIKGVADEVQQRTFYSEVRTWAESRELTVFFFEAFDENWKGGDHPNEVEKHWGLFNADRTPKLVLQPSSD